MEDASRGSGLHPDRGIPGWRRHSDGSERRDTRSKTSLGTIEISSEHSAVPGRSELPTNSDRDGRFSLLIVSAHASERMEHVSAMRASSTTVAYCPELAESSTHCANKISVAWNPLSCPFLPMLRFGSTGLRALYSPT